MTCLLGIDLGTSSVKAVLVDEAGRLLGVGTQEYPLETPQPGWAEQDPETWWQATVRAVHQAMGQVGPHEVLGIGLSGQMHGTVLVDSALSPMGSAIIWPDQRSAAEVDELVAQVGRDRLARIAGTAPATGFMGPTLLWLKHHDPARLERAHACLLPKDYLRLRLTGRIATEASDASATAIFDVRRREWSQEIITTLQLPTAVLPPVLEPADVAGDLVEPAAGDLGLPAGVPVVAGCGDQVAQAVGNGLLDPGLGSVTVGSGGQVFAPLAVPVTDEHLRLHTFCHAPADRWYMMGAMLTAGLSLRWLRDLLGMAHEADAYAQLAQQGADVPPGADGLLFLPYLAGERSPLMDPAARGCFVGLTLRHQRGHLARAIMEGVAFALRQILEIMTALDASVAQLLAVGNGLASPVWRQIAADILARSLFLPAGQEQAGVGAALLAGIGVGLYDGYAGARRVVPAPVAATEPEPSRVEFYQAQYRWFCELYPALQSTLHSLSRVQGKGSQG